MMRRSACSARVIRANPTQFTFKPAGPRARFLSFGALLKPRRYASAATPAEMVVSLPWVATIRGTSGSPPLQRLCSLRDDLLFWLFEFLPKVIAVDDGLAVSAVSLSALRCRGRPESLDDRCALDFEFAFGSESTSGSFLAAYWGPRGEGPRRWLGTVRLQYTGQSLSPQAVAFCRSGLSCPKAESREFEHDAVSNPNDRAHVPPIGSRCSALWRVVARGLLAAGSGQCFVVVRRVFRCDCGNGRSLGNCLARIFSSRDSRNCGWRPSIRRPVISLWLARWRLIWSTRRLLDCRIVPVQCAASDGKRNRGSGSLAMRCCRLFAISLG